MNESAHVARWLGLLIDLYLIVGVLLVIVLVPLARKALRDSWFATADSGFLAWGVVIFSALSVWWRACS